MKTIEDFRNAYAAGKKPEDVLRSVWESIRDEEDQAIFISKASWEMVSAKLDAISGKEDLPLWGIPFVAKDNIDLLDCRQRRLVLHFPMILPNLQRWFSCSKKRGRSAWVKRIWINSLRGSLA